MTDYRWGVWADPARDRAYVANEPGGLAVIDISNQAAPNVDTMLLTADLAYDICVDGALAYVADGRGGLQVLDVSNPAMPVGLGVYDSAYTESRTAAARDSLAFVGWESTPYFLSIDVTDPTRPVHIGGGAVQTIPEDMVLRDSFVYVAGRLRLNIINVARPREPVLVGSCVLPGSSGDLFVLDTLAFASCNPTQIINVRNPASPVIIGTIPTYGHGVEILWPYAFVPALFDSLDVYDVSNPASPQLVTNLKLSGRPFWQAGIARVDSLLFIGGEIIHVVDVSDPTVPHEVGAWIPPMETRRLSYSAPYLYAACYEAGVCILDTSGLGIVEERRASPDRRLGLILTPNPALDQVVVHASTEVADAVLWDVSGREVRRITLSDGTATLSLAGLRSGVYFCSTVAGGRRQTVKLVKR